MADFVIPIPVTGDMKGFLFANTEGVPADGVQHGIRATNNSPDAVPLRIKEVWLWIGADVGAVIDVGGQVDRLSDGSVMGAIGWDHYANPTGPSTVVFTHDPGFLLAVGDSVDLNTSGNDYAGGKVSFATAAWMVVTRA